MLALPLSRISSNPLTSQLKSQTGNALLSRNMWRAVAIIRATSGFHAYSVQALGEDHAAGLAEPCASTW
eukprot:s1614_g17.t1